MCWSLSRVQLFAAPWTAAHQAPQSMEFSRQEHWSGLPCPPPGDLPLPGTDPRSPALQAASFPSGPAGLVAKVNLISRLALKYAAGRGIGSEASMFADWRHLLSPTPQAPGRVSSLQPGSFLAVLGSRGREGVRCQARGLAQAELTETRGVSNATPG